MSNPIAHSSIDPAKPTACSLKLRLAIPSPVERLFDYLPLSDTDFSALRFGMRFKVNFGHRQLTAYYIDSTTQSDIPQHKLKSVIEQIDFEDSPLDHHLATLISWAARYYHHGLGLCIHNALPKKIRQGSSVLETRTAWRLSAKGHGLAPEALKSAKRQHQVIQLLRTHTYLEHSDFKELKLNHSILKALQHKELIENFDNSCVHKPFFTRAPSIHNHSGEHQCQTLKSAALTLNSEQQDAVDSILSTQGFRCHLLNGVTGSGKTEVYLQAIEHVLNQQQQALVLIPEIALTPQTISRFENRFNHPCVILHSKLGHSTRLKNWRCARQGEAAIVIGTRSAIFTPFLNLGMIIVDEEHDSSYKQQTGFRYSAKDVAVRRAQLLDIPIVLGSATPSCESLYNAQLLRYTEHQLKQRAGEARIPQTQLIDTRQQPLQEGFSKQLLDALQHCIAQRQQAIIFINRRGYAPLLLCHNCGWLAQCNNCDARLTVHRKKHQLRCHHCNYQQALIDSCPSCNAQDMRTLGSGTQRSEAFLQQQFPSTAVIRIDSDSTQSNNSLGDLLARLHPSSGEPAKPAILIGTQILAKGHHLPNVSLVAILDSDAWLFSNDFRAHERMAQLMTQVSGRAGRGSTPGRTLIQTHLPEHPFWIQLFSGGYPVLIKQILEQRRQTLMPPYSHLAVIHAQHPHAERVLELLGDARQWLNQYATQQPGLELIGPYPSALARKARHYRFLLQLKHPQRSQLHFILQALSNYLQQHSLTKKVHWSIDVDPQEVV